MENKKLQKYMFKAPGQYEAIGICAAFLGFLIIGAKGYPNLALFCFITFSGTILFIHRKHIRYTIKQIVTRFMLSSAAFFCAKILAVRHFNQTYGIYPEYLNFSTTLWALLIASTLFLTIPILGYALLFFKSAKKAKSQNNDWIML